MDRHLRTFCFEGLEIESSVIEDKCLDDGGRAFLIQSSCNGRVATNWTSCGLGISNFDKVVTSSQEANAKRFARELRGVQPPMPPAFVGLRFQPSTTDTWSATFMSAVNLDLETTLVAREIAEFCKFPRAGTSHQLTDRYGNVVHADGLLARIKFGDLEFEQEVCALELGDGPMCVVGQNMVTYMRNLGADAYYRFVDHDVSRLHRDALRGRFNSVLLVGPFGEEGRRALSELRQILFDRGYRGVLLDEFPDAPDQSLDQKLMFLASLCRFVICVDSSAAGHYLELELCARFNLVTAVITAAGYRGRLSSAMLYDLELRSPYLKAFDCASDNVPGAVGQIIEWAENTAEQKSIDYDRIYDWRSNKKKRST